MFWFIRLHWNVNVTQQLLVHLLYNYNTEFSLTATAAASVSIQALAAHFLLTKSEFSRNNSTLAAELFWCEKSRPLKLTMTLFSFIGCALTAYGPPAALFTITVASDPVKITILLLPASQHLTIYRNRYSPVVANLQSSVVGEVGGRGGSL